MTEQSGQPEPDLDIAMTAGDGGDEIYHGYSTDDEDQPQSTEDSMSDRRDIADPLDEGYSPPEKWSAGQGWGNTPLEEELGETLDQRLAQEVPEPDPYAQAEAEAAAGDIVDDDVVDALPASSEVGEFRAGRLVEPDEGVHVDTEGDLIAYDEGIDGGAASAEEAAVHIVDEDQLP
jgi:asparagine synthetase B (glutamine-hydrolysing)